MRRLSIHRATTVGPKSSLCQVIIKNTCAIRDLPHSSSSSTINRSQSLLTTNRILVVASSRGDRVRLENLMSDVWTRDILPFPGMTGRSRGEHLVRTSASSMIRKLSVASIASNFTKRSASQPSLVSLHHQVDENLEAAETRRPYVEGHETISKDTSQIPFVVASEEAMTARLRTAQGDNFRDTNVSRTSIFTGASSEENSASTMRRLATLRIHRSFHNDKIRSITPPLRTSSANGLRANRVPSGGPATYVSQEKENQLNAKHSKWNRAAGINKGLSTEGLKAFFR